MAKYPYKQIGTQFDRVRVDMNENMRDIESDIREVDADSKRTVSSAIEAKSEAMSARAQSQRAEAKADRVRAEFDEVIADGDSNAEVAASRVDSEGVTRNSLPERLAADHESINGKVTTIGTEMVTNALAIEDMSRKKADLEGDTQTSQYYFYRNIRNFMRDSEFSLGVLADSHFDYSPNRLREFNSYREIKSFRTVAERVGVADSVLLGDIMNGDTPNSVMFNSLFELDGITGDMLKIHGNHDDGSYFESLQIRNPNQYGNLTEFSRLTNTDIFNYYYSNNKVDAVDPNTLAFFKDYTRQKIRLIHVNTSDLPVNLRDAQNKLRYPGINSYGITPRQIRWLNDNAFNFSSKGSDAPNWKIVIISHVPLVPELSNHTVRYWNGTGYSNDTATGTYMPNYYSGGKENVANEGIVRQMIRNINRGTNNVLKPYHNNETKPANSGQFYFSIEDEQSTPGGTARKQMTAAMHDDNYRYFGTNLTIDGTSNDFVLDVSNPHAVPVIACLSGHTHRDDFHTADDTVHHVTLAALANSNETYADTLNNYAHTFMIVKNRELFFFRQGRGKGTVTNANVLGGTTSYGVERFKDKRFTF